MGRQPDQQSDMSARSAAQNESGPSSMDADSSSSQSDLHSHLPPAFEEIVMHPSPHDTQRIAAQGRDRTIRPTASSGNGTPRRRIWSSVEEFPLKRPSPSTQTTPTSPLQAAKAPPTTPQPPSTLPDPWQRSEPQVISPPIDDSNTAPVSPPSPQPSAQNTTTSASKSHPTAPSTPANPPISSESQKAAYSDKTERIVAWSNLLRSLQPFIWAAVILVVVVPLVGKALLFYSSTTPVQQAVKPLTEVMVPAIPHRGNMDKALLEAVETAHASAQAFAQDELDDWEIKLEGRVDHFLDWYFGYLNQKKMEFMTPLVWVSSAAIHSVNPKHMKANEAVMARFTGEFQKQFAKQVLVPQTAQMRLENLTTETVNHYLLALRQNMDQVQVKYRIPQGQWDRYLSDISTTIQDTEGNLSNLSLKMLVGGSGYLLTKPLVLATVTKIGTKVSSKMAGTAAAKLAAKTGGTVAAELGTSLVDPIVGVGIFIWDIWDYQHTVDLERPLLKANLLDYLQGVERSLLNDPETGVLSAIAQLEQGIFQSL